MKYKLVIQIFYPRMFSLKINTDISVFLLYSGVAKAFWRSLILLKVSDSMPQAYTLLLFIHKNIQSIFTEQYNKTDLRDMWDKFLETLKSVLPHYVLIFANQQCFVKSGKLLLNIECLYSDLLLNRHQSLLHTLLYFQLTISDYLYFEKFNSKYP